MNQLGVEGGDDEVQLDDTKDVDVEVPVDRKCPVNWDHFHSLIHSNQRDCQLVDPSDPLLMVDLHLHLNQFLNLLGKYVLKRIA